MADLLSFAPVRVFDDNGDPGAGYRASFYQSGTTTAVTVYAADGVTVLEQPVEADAEGVFPTVLFQAATAVKAVITDASGATVYTVDPVVKVPAGASGASEVTFDPTADLPFTNVQDAIVGAAVLAPLTTNGLIARTADDTFVPRTITAGAGISVSNGDGVSGNPVITSSSAGRNLIINGQGRINQRGYTSGTATSGANEYTLDRWRVVTSGQSLTFTGTDAGRTMTAPAGGVEQVIEGGNIEGGTYVISWTGTATCTVDGTARASGDTFTLTANTDATVRFSGGTFTDVQVERASVATPFEWLPLSEELRRCQRYYWRPEISYTIQGFGTGNVVYNQIWFPTTMRAAPTITSNWSSGVSATGGSRTAVGTHGAQTSVANTGTGNYSATINWTAFDAEL